MKENIIIINGPNLNLLGKREKSHYGNVTYSELEKICLKYAKNKDINVIFKQSNIEGEIVTIIQKAREKYEGLIINAAGFTHTSVAIRDALTIFKKPSIELHI